MKDGGGFVSLISHQKPYGVANMSIGGGRMESRATFSSQWGFPNAVISVCSSRQGFTWSFCCCRCYCCRWWRPADKTREWDTHGKKSTDTVLGQKSCNQHVSLGQGLQAEDKVGESCPWMYGRKVAGINQWVPCSYITERRERGC